MKIKRDAQKQQQKHTKCQILSFHIVAIVNLNYYMRDEIVIEN